MKDEIDELIVKHKDSKSEYGIYTLKCSIKSFKALQRLMINEYKIAPLPGTQTDWKHEFKKEALTYGTILFDNLEINVTRYATFKDEPLFRNVSAVNEKFWKSRTLKNN